MKTWGVLRSEIHSEMNTEGEEFVSNEEMLTWGNDALDEAEKITVDLYDKYLETEGYLPLVLGEDEIELPEDIYANKITGLHYVSASDRYEILGIKTKSEILGVNAQDKYRFRVINKTEGRRLKLYPPARETSAQHVVIYYIREAKKIESDDDKINIPIADSYVKQYIKDRIKEKEIGPMNFNWPSPALAKEEERLISALNRMIPDDHSDEVEPDMDFYEDVHSGWEY